MSTAIDLTFNCSSCNGTIAAPDIREHNAMQWRCPNCSEWSNWMKHTVEPNETITPRGNISEMGKAILAQAKALGIKVVEIDPKDLIGYLTSPSNSKYNVADEGRWDLCDDDGDYHSPSWYIAALHSTGDAYMALHRRDISAMTPEQEAHHMQMLDDALEEMEIYERYVDKLFGR